MRAARIVAVVLLAAASVQAVWIRPERRGEFAADAIRAVPLSRDHPASWSLGPFHVSGAWRLESDSPRFGGLSALRLHPDGRLIAASDRGSLSIFPKPGAKGESRILPFIAQDDPDRVVHDVEGLTLTDAALWVSLETSNRIMRASLDGGNRVWVAPPAMRWGPNEGAETLLRLDDGRFIVISEAGEPDGAATYPLLIFPGDPIQDAQSEAAILTMPDGFRPVDAAALADGRVLVLGRAWRLPFRFETVIAVIDAGAIEPGATLQARTIAKIAGGRLADNYEGIAAETAPDGGVTVWLVSDNNEAVLLQQTMLLRLEAADLP